MGENLWKLLEFALENHLRNNNEKAAIETIILAIQRIEKLPLTERLRAILRLKKIVSNLYELEPELGLEDLYAGYRR